MTSQIFTKHSENENRLGWKFLADGGRMTHDMSHIEVTAGLEVRLNADQAIVACQYGLHYSERPLDALQYAESCIISRVEDIGDQRDTSEGDKVATNALRYLTSPVDTERTLHEFAIWCAEQALSLIEKPDPRSLNALEVKRRWLDGKASDEDLAAAWGRSLGRSQGRSLGRSQGHSLGRSQGRSLGRSLGHSQGHSQGRNLGRSRGRSQGRSQGRSPGHSQGRNLGRSRGRSQGRSQGRTE